MIFRRRKTLTEIHRHWTSLESDLDAVRGSDTFLNNLYWLVRKRLSALELWFGVWVALDEMEEHEGEFKEERRAYEKVIRKHHKEWLREDRGR